MRFFLLGQVSGTETLTEPVEVPNLCLRQAQAPYAKVLFLLLNTSFKDK